MSSLEKNPSEDSAAKREQMEQSSTASSFSLGQKQWKKNRRAEKATKQQVEAVRRGSERPEEKQLGSKVHKLLRSVKNNKVIDNKHSPNDPLQPGSPLRRKPSPYRSIPFRSPSPTPCRCNPPPVSRSPRPQASGSSRDT